MKMNLGWKLLVFCFLMDGYKQYNKTQMEEKITNVNGEDTQSVKWGNCVLGIRGRR